MEAITKVSDKHYVVNNAKGFQPQEQVTEANMRKAFDFAVAMMPIQRTFRTGGLEWDNKALLSAMIQSKMAEFGFYQAMKQNKAVDYISYPDLRISGKGKWDSGDFVVNKSLVTVRHTHDACNLLLLRTDDWDKRGNYIHDIKIRASDVFTAYDRIYLVRVAPTSEDILFGVPMEFAENHALLNPEDVWEVVKHFKWLTEISGYITKAELISDVMGKELMIEKSAVLDNRLTMATDFYYVQTGDLHQDN